MTFSGLAGYLGGVSVAAGDRHEKEN